MNSVFVADFDSFSITVANNFGRECRGHTIVSSYLMRELLILLGTVLKHEKTQIREGKLEPTFKHHANNPAPGPGTAPSFPRGLELPTAEVDAPLTAFTRVSQPHYY